MQNVIELIVTINQHFFRTYYSHNKRTVTVVTLKNTVEFYYSKKHRQRIVPSPVLPRPLTQRTAHGIIVSRDVNVYVIIMIRFCYFPNSGVTHNIEQHQRNTRLLCGKSVGAVHQFLHHRQLSNQLRHLLRHVQAVPGDVQRAVHQGIGADKPETRSRRQFPLLVGQRAQDLHQRIAFVK